MLGDGSPRSWTATPATRRAGRFARAGSAPREARPKQNRVVDTPAHARARVPRREGSNDGHAHSAERAGIVNVKR